LPTFVLNSTLSPKTAIPLPWPKNLSVPVQAEKSPPRALQAAGIKVVIAKSFTFIYGRNQANNGLLGIKIKDDRFYDLAREGESIEIDVNMVW
jgi:hypothetical protein